MTKGWRAGQEQGRGDGEPKQAEAVEEGIKGPGQALKTHAEPVEMATSLAHLGADTELVAPRRHLGNSFHRLQG